MEEQTTQTWTDKKDAEVPLRPPLDHQVCNETYSSKLQLKLRQRRSRLTRTHLPKASASMFLYNVAEDLLMRMPSMLVQVLTLDLAFPAVAIK